MSFHSLSTVRRIMIQSRELLLSDNLKICYLDTETTGLDAEKNGVVQIAGFIEVNGVHQHGFNMNIDTFPNDVLDPEALRINGKTVEQIRACKPPQLVHKAFVALLDKFVDKYDRNDKFYLCGYNVGFDDNFMRAWFRKNGNEYYNSYFHGYKIDVFSMAIFLRAIGRLKTPNLKLSSVCEHYGIPLEAHTALSDITATRELFKRFREMFKDAS